MQENDEKLIHAEPTEVESESRIKTPDAPETADAVSHADAPEVAAQGDARRGDVETRAASEAQNAPTETCPERKKGIRAWWARHKPSKRRFIQIYAFLLYNAYVRGFVKGEIFTGLTKSACVPGLNCYSCPGAVAACPLGALQNALTGTGHGSAYYMIGILLLYGLIFGRTICGFLCPVGLGQDLAYKIKTPKLKKSKVTRVLSYFKYVILVVLVVGIPTIYAIDKTAVPGFCKYICPAGTLEGAIMLLIHPGNDSLYGMLGVLFSWKTAVLVCVFTASIFIYRVFCRFLCPLGAIYGLFNRFALLGIKVDRSKCTHCGKCVTKCKMDIKSVGDHECINCGECIYVCPTKAIRFRGGRVFLDNVDGTVAAHATPTDIAPKIATSADGTVALKATAPNAGGKAAEARAAKTAAACSAQAVAAGGGTAKRKRGRAFWIKLVCILSAAALYIGIFTYANFFAAADEVGVEYLIAVESQDGDAGLLSFTVGGSDKTVSTRGDGDGTRENPYEVASLKGKWEVPVDGINATYFKFTAKKAATYKIEGENVGIKIYYLMMGKAYALYDRSVDGDEFTLSLEAPSGYGNGVGDICYDFALDGYNGVDRVALSDYRGRVTVVNFWGTWCGPCVAELPEFEEVREQNPQVAMIAVHSAYMSENGAVQRFLDDKGWSEWGIIFAQDTGTKQKSDVFTLLGGKTNAYPRTLVLNADGVIVSEFDGKVSAKQLTDAINKAKGE